MKEDGIPGPEEYLADLELTLKRARSDKKLYDLIVNAPFNNRLHPTALGLGFLAFLLENKTTGMIDRISISDTEVAQGAINMTNLPFHDMKVPIDYRNNLVAKAISTGKHQKTNDWHLLTDPALPAEESRFNQAASGVASSIVYPLNKTQPRGAIIFQFYINMDQIDNAHHNFMQFYTDIVSSVLRQRSRKNKN